MQSNNKELRVVRKVKERKEKKKNCLLLPYDWSWEIHVGPLTQAAVP